MRDFPFFYPIVKILNPIFKIRLSFSVVNFKTSNGNPCVRGIVEFVDLNYNFKDSHFLVFFIFHFVYRMCALKLSQIP